VLKEEQQRVGEGKDERRAENVLNDREMEEKRWREESQEEIRKMRG